MWLADISAAVLLGALSGMGIGGGGLFTIYLTLIRGTAQLEAQGMNLFFFIFASAASLFVHTARRNINYPLVLSLAAVGIPASLVGSLAAARSDPEIVRLAFGIMLTAAGFLSLIKEASFLFPFKKERKK